MTTPVRGPKSGVGSVLASAVQNRKAERPVNALLNYLYALVEVEAILACQAVGPTPIRRQVSSGAATSNSTTTGTTSASYFVGGRITQ